MPGGGGSDGGETASSVASPPGMRVAPSGAHSFVAVGGASELGSVASFGWIAPQAANTRAKPATNAFRRVGRSDFPRCKSTANRGAPSSIRWRYNCRPDRKEAGQQYGNPGYHSAYAHIRGTANCR